MTLDPEPILFLQALLQSLAPATAIEDVRVRAWRLEAADQPPVILLENAGELPSRELPVFLPARVSYTAYGRTEDEAMVIWRTIRNLMHGRGPTTLDGIGMYRAFDEVGPRPREDPNTTWAAKFGVLDIYMPTVALTGAGS